jgi:hypothetical protein
MILSLLSILRFPRNGSGGCGEGVEHPIFKASYFMKRQNNNNILNPFYPFFEDGKEE